MENYFTAIYGEHSSQMPHTKIDKEVQPYQNKLPQILPNPKLFIPIIWSAPGLRQFERLNIRGQSPEKPTPAGEMYPCPGLTPKIRKAK